MKLQLQLVFLFFFLSFCTIVSWPTEQTNKTKTKHLIDTKINIAIKISNNTLEYLENLNTDESFGPCIWSFGDLTTAYLPAVLRNLDSKLFGQAQKSVQDAKSTIHFCSQNVPPDLPTVKSANQKLNDLLSEVSDLIKLLK